MDRENQGLENQLNALQADLAGLKVIIDELHDDHATNKTTIDECRTAIIELIDDHATFKTAVDETKTAVDELIDDHASFITLTSELKDDVDLISASVAAAYAKLDADSGVNDTDFVSLLGTSGSSAPLPAAAIAAADVATITASKPTAGPATLTATDPTASAATLTATKYTLTSAAGT